MKKTLNEYLEELNVLFLSTNDLYKAHELSKSILQEMADNTDLFHEVVKKNLMQEGFLLSKRNNPVIALEMNKTLSYTLVANCWMPLPDGNTDITHQSIHHHGGLLLTSIAPIGSGYSSIIFKKGYKVNDDRTADMAIDKIYSNTKGNLEFVDTFTPHVVFYPGEFSVTYALWSETKSSTLSKWKKHSSIQKYKTQIKKTLALFGLKKKIGLNVVENFDFYPTNGKIVSMKDRVIYPVGTNKNFLENLFYIFQKTGFKDYDFLKKLKSHKSPEEYMPFDIILNEFISGKEFQNEFEDCHIGIDKINFTKKELLSCIK
jgi:hypothetical protein